MLFKYIKSKIIHVAFKLLKGVIMEKVIARILEEIVKKLSPGLRAEIKKKVLELEAYAKGTVTNPWDDIGVMILKILLGIE